MMKNEVIVPKFNIHDLVIREGRKEDIPQVYVLIKELAAYEKLSEEVRINEAKLLVDGFGEKPLYGLIVAEIKDQIVGMAIYYFRYSSWKGKRLYIEDLIVNIDYRAYGIGKLLRC